VRENAVDSAETEALRSEATAIAEGEALLREAEFQDARPVWYSSNYVYLSQMCGQAGEQFAAIYKPLKGENPLWDFPDGCLYKREAAAYELAKLLGWNFVPPTVVRDGPHGIGSLQLFIKHDPESHFFVQREVPGFVPQLQRMAVFDLIVNNADRKGGHCLLDEHGQIWGIDHGLCFHYQYKLRSVIWDWAGEAVPTNWLDETFAAGKAIAGCAAAATPFLALVGDAEVAALLGRIEKLQQDRRFPTPGANRHYPWPLV
jgi:uncharacterized repeat protein (TIGR03843 family)